MTWPEERVRAAEVRAWIRARIPDCEEVDGPTLLYRVNDWSLTARFTVERAAATPEGSPREGSVVCKIAFCPEDATAPIVHRLLRTCTAANAPELLAWETRGSQTWLLFAPFAGTVIGTMGALAPVVELARTLARIQRGVAALPPAERAGILHQPVAAVPRQFEEILRCIREEGLCSPERDPTLSHDALALFRPHVAAWAAELSAAACPESLDHPDLNTQNAVLFADGRVLIYDWEGATIGCPFFSMDLLLENMARADAPPATRQESGLAYTPEQLAVRRAYLEELTWGTVAERERALDAALCLSPVHRAYQHLTFFASLGSDTLASPEGGIEKHATVARFLRNALRRWTVMLP